MVCVFKNVFSTLFLYALLQYGNAVCAADNYVTGRVTGSGGDGLAGINIVEKGTSNGTITDVYGNYKINVRGDAILIFSGIGYPASEEDVANRSVVDMSLSPAPALFNETVHTGPGIEMPYGALDYTIYTLQEKQIDIAANPVLSTGLYGKSPGLLVSGTSGGLFAPVSLQLRGPNSLLSENRPLIVVDGVPVADHLPQYAGSKNTFPGPSINDISPGDIASIHIINGGAGAALYGADAADGVIFIETKGAGYNQGVRVSVGSAVTWDEGATWPEFQNIFGAGNGPTVDLRGTPGVDHDGEFKLNSEGERVYPNSWLSFGPEMNEQEVRWWDGELRPWSAQPDNYRSLFTGGLTTTTDASVAHSGAHHAVRLSYNLMDHTGIWPGSRLQRHAFGLRSSNRISDRLSIGLSIRYVYTTGLNAPQELDMVTGFGFPRSARNDLLAEKYKNEEGYLVTAEEAPHISYRNPMRLLWDTYENSYGMQQSRLLASSDIRYDLTEWLHLRMTMGADLAGSRFEARERSLQPADAGPTGSFGMESGTYSGYYGDVMLGYSENFGGRFAVQLGVGGRLRRREIRQQYSATQGGLVAENWFSLQNSADAAVSDLSTMQEQVHAWLGTGSVSWDNALFFNFSLSRDRNRHTARRVGYGSLGAAWLFTKHIPLPSWVSSGKLYANWAHVGNSAPMQPDYAGAEVGTYNGVQWNAVDPSVAADGFGPEQQKSTELGAALALFGSRLSMNLTWYRNRNYNLVFPLPTSFATGSGDMLVNTGEMHNRGVEWVLGAKLVDRNDFQWEVVLNWARNRNDVVALAGHVDALMVSDANWPLYREARTGMPYGVFVSYPYLRDIEGNKLVDDQGYYIRDTETAVVGDPAPDWIGGIISQMRYRGFTLDFSIDMKSGGDLFSLSNYYGMQTGKLAESVYGRDEAHGGLPYYRSDDGTWTLLEDHKAETAPNGTLVYHDGIVSEGVNNNGVSNDQVIPASDYYRRTYFRYSGFYEEGIYDNSWVRMREFRLGYDLASSWLQSAWLRSLQVSFVGRNLFFLHKSLPHVDVESGGGTSSGLAYQESGSLPSTRSAGFSIRAEFGK